MKRPYASAQAYTGYGKAIGLDVLQAQVDLTSSRFHLIRYAVAYEIGKARVKQIYRHRSLVPTGQAKITGVKSREISRRKKTILGLSWGY